MSYMTPELFTMLIGGIARDGVILDFVDADRTLEYAEIPIERAAGIAGLGVPFFCDTEATQFRLLHEADYVPVVDTHFDPMRSWQATDPAALKVLRHSSIRLVTDPPKKHHNVTMDEAELLLSWGRPVLAFSQMNRVTFWARPEDMPALVTLRIIRTEEP